LNDLLAIIAKLGIELHPDRINILADKVEKIDSAEQFILLKSNFGSHIDNNILSALENAWKNNKNISPVEIAAALKSASATAIENEKRGKTEIVWTGPSASSIPVRHTEQVLCEVIDSATRRLFIVSFVAYEIESIINSMRNAIGRNVQIDFLLESSIEHGGRVNQDSIKMIKSIFPSAKVYTWAKKSKEMNNKVIGAIHAKCAIADGELAFITSANLTSAAMERNIELGVLVKGGHLPSELQKHLDSLIVAKVFERV